MKKGLVIIVAIALVIFKATFAFASWSAPFVIDTGGPTFDQIGAWWISGDKFENPAFSDFTEADWYNYNASNINAYAFGSATSSLTFNANFEDPQSAGTNFLIMASLSGEVLDQARLFTFDGIEWDGTEVSQEEWEELGGGGPIAPIPEPATMLLFGAGTLGFGIFRRTKK